MTASLKGYLATVFEDFCWHVTEIITVIFQIGKVGAHGSVDRPCPRLRGIGKLTGIGKSMCHKLLGIDSFGRASEHQQHQIHSARVVDILLSESF